MGKFFFSIVSQPSSPIYERWSIQWKSDPLFGLHLEHSGSSFNLLLQNNEVILSNNAHLKKIRCIFSDNASLIKIVILVKYDDRFEMLIIPILIDIIDRLV